MNVSETATWFRKARELRKYTQKDAANLLNYSPQTISLWEIGRVDPKMDSVVAFTNAMKLDFISFLTGELKDSEDIFLFDNNKLIHFLLPIIEEKKISKDEIQDIINVSRPTLRKITSGESLLSFTQYLKLCEALSIEPGKPFEGEKKKPEKAAEKKKINLKSIQYLAVTASIAMIAISISLPLSLAMTKEKPSQIPPETSDTTRPSENKPSTDDFPSQLPNDDHLVTKLNISIDTYNRRLDGFVQGEEYLVNHVPIIAQSDSVEIDKDWYGTYVDIERTKTKQKNCIFIDYTKFQNFFEEDLCNGYIPFESLDEDFDERIKDYNAMAEQEDNKKSLVLNEEDVSTLKDSLRFEIPYMKDEYFHKSLIRDEQVLHNSYQYLDYEIKKDVAADEDYVLIHGLKADSNQIKEIYIPEYIDGIKDIRLDDYAFDSEKNENLSAIAFEAKPTFVGDYAFKGLSLDILDFGCLDDDSYQTRYNLKLKQVSSNEGIGYIYYSNAFCGIKHIDKARLPLEFEPDKMPSCSYNSLFGEKPLCDLSDMEYRGISSFILPVPKCGPYTYNGIKVLNSKIYSLYIPKGVCFKPDYNYTSKDLYLRLIKYESGYDYTTTISSVDNEPLDYLGNEYYSLSRCYALEYYLRDFCHDFYVPANFFRSSFSLRGVLPFERITKCNRNCFAYARLPKYINLKRINVIQEGAFQKPFGLEEVHIYKADTVTKVNPLKIEKCAFVNSSQSCCQIKKIVFHGFIEEEMELDPNYKSDDIQAEMVED